MIWLEHLQPRWLFGEGTEGQMPAAETPWGAPRSSPPQAGIAAMCSSHTGAFPLLCPGGRSQPWDAACGSAEPVRAGEGQAAGAGAVPAAGEAARGTPEPGQRYRGQEGQHGTGGT